MSLNCWLILIKSMEIKGSYVYKKMNYDKM